MSVAETIAGWARELSGVGGPNTLLWAPARRDGYLDLTTAHPGGVSMLLAGRPTSLSDLVREAGAFEEARAVARALHAKAEELRVERGLVAGFVAIGVASWDPPRARAVIEAPVLLRTCVLRPVNAAATDFDLDLGAGVEVNPALVNYLRSVSGIEIDPVALAALTTLKGHGNSGETFDPYPVYAALGRLCADVPGFAVAPRLLVGSYPYAKPDMVADVGSQAQWLAQLDLVAALTGDEPARARTVQRLPAPAPDPDPEQELSPLDLDPTQAQVLAAARAGRPLVLEAPVGTGRTQTLAALVATMAHDGRRVLYVARHAASRTGLQTRLADVGLADLVLDLTGAGEDRGRVAAELGSALERIAGLDDETLAEFAEPAGRVARATAMAERQEALADHAAALHEVRQPWGVTAYEIQQAMAELAARHPAPGSRVRISGPALQQLSRERVAELAAHLRAAGDAGAWAADTDGDPWYAADIRTQADVDRAGEIVGRLAGDGLSVPAGELDGILAESSLPPAHTPLDWASALHTMRGVQQTLEVFRPEIFDVPLDEHVVATASKAERGSESVQLGAWTRSRVRRQARRLLRPGRPPADLHAELVSARQQRTAWHRLVGAGGRPEISPRLDEAGLVYQQLADDLRWLGERLAPTENGGDLLGLPLPLLRGRLNRLAERRDRLAVLPQVGDVVEELRGAGMGEILDDLARRGVAPLDVEAELDHVWWASLSDEVTRRDPRYAGHDGPALRAAVESLGQLDAGARLIDAGRIRGVVDLRARAAARERPRQVDLLHAQARLHRGQLPFVDVLRETEQVLTALRPCLMVSPYAVAQLLPPGEVFDLVIVDDASSVSTAEVVSALSRARTTLIVADPSGPRPTSFRVSPEDGRGAAASVDGADSLYAAAARVLPRLRLGWRHAGVDDRLALALGGAAEAEASGQGAEGASPGQPAAGAGPMESAVAGDTAYVRGAPGARRSPRVRLERVQGTAAVQPGSDAAIEWTEAEVHRVVELVLAHAAGQSGRSLAVLTLTPAMAYLVKEAVREAIGRVDETSAAYLQGTGAEPFIVAPFDTALVGLRDVVIVAVGYGRTPHGRVLHRFPTLGDSDSAERLRAATEAARDELIVVSTLGADDLDAHRLRTPGPLAMHALLARAEAGALAGAAGAAPVEGASEGGPLLGYLAARLRQEGFTVAEGVGTGRDRVALAVGHPRAPERWLVAVEDDGASYAALPDVRFRELLRPRLLQRRGWAHVRVWSTDLYRDPAREVARVVAAARIELKRVAPSAESAMAAPRTSESAAAKSEPSVPERESAALEPESAAPESAPTPESSPPAPVVGDAASETGDALSAMGDAAPDPSSGALVPEADPGLDEAAGAPADEQPGSTPEPPAAAKPRRRSDFDRSRDDLDSGWGEHSGASSEDDAYDRWLKAQRPPHWE